MPIREPGNYPDNWDEIREAILFRAGMWGRGKQDWKLGAGIPRCECAGECGVEHLQPPDFPERSRCNELHGHQGKHMNGKVVLTIAHLDHDASLGNHEDDNLKAMCQRCHLRFDSEENRLRRTGQPRLIDTI